MDTGDWELLGTGDPQQAGPGDKKELCAEGLPGHTHIAWVNPLN